MVPEPVTLRPLPHKGYEKVEILLYKFKSCTILPRTLVDLVCLGRGRAL